MTDTAHDTKTRILDAALATLQEAGYHGASARAIARQGDFNQALIFYHFGSVDELLLEAMERNSANRLSRYRERIEGVKTLNELIGVAKDLHAEDLAQGSITILTQILAGMQTNEDLRPRVAAAFAPWTEVVEQAVAQVVTGTPLEQMLPVEDIAYAISALFLGIELLSHVDPDGTANESLFQTLGVLAGMLEGIMGMMGSQG